MTERTLIAVMSCALYPYRRAAVRETWAALPLPPNVDLNFFVGIGATALTDEPGLIHLIAPDDYAHLPEKTYAIVRYARERGYDRLIKVDDDTYLRLPDALAVLSEAACVGHRRDNPPHNSFLPYPQGGCYSLNVHAMSAVLNSPDYFTTGLEDGAVGRALYRFGIGVTDSERIKSDYRLGQPAAGNDIVSAHHVSPEVMRLIHDQTVKGDR